MKTNHNFIRSRIRFDRNELSGAFGDIGTDLPLIIGMIASSGINGAGVFVVFGLMQVATALIYGIPMPVQPLKAVALIVITQKIGGDRRSTAAVWLSVWSCFSWPSPELSIASARSSLWRWSEEFKWALGCNCPCWP